MSKEQLEGTGIVASPKAAAAGRTLGGQAVAAWLAGVALAVLLAITWAPVFAELVRWWSEDADYSHGFLVPLASLYFARRAWIAAGPPWQRCISPPTVTAGLAVMALGLVGHVAAWFAATLLGEVLALMVLLGGMLLIAGGTRALRAYGFAVGFLIFMAPLPPEWYRPLAISMQQMTAVLSTRLLELCGMPVYQQGNVIFVPGYSMEVGAACSGLRQMLAFLAVSVAMGELSGRGWVFRLALAGLALPTAMLANCVRILATAVTMMIGGKQWAEGVYHTLEGLATALIGLLLLLAAAWFLGKAEDRWRRRRGVCR
jgi:exosortase